VSDELVIVPSDGDGYVELARTKQGRLFRKHILNKGELIHPTTKKKIKVDDTFIGTLKDNFAKGYCDIVQVPLAGKNNEHTEAPEKNIGEVIGIEEKDNKVYALIDARKPEFADQLGKTLLGASAMLHLDYTDTKTDTKVGPTLLHTCVTNRPYVTGLDDYQEILSATSDTSQGAVLLSADVVEVTPTEEKDEMGDEPTKETPAKPTKDELLSILKSEHGVDVSALQAKAEEGTQAAQLSKALVTALSDAGVVKLAAENTTEAPSTEDVVGAVAELAQNNVTLTDKVSKLERRDAQYAVDALVEAGRVLPAQKNAFVDLKLSNPSMFDALVPAQPIVKLSTEDGVSPPEDAAHKKNIDEEVARLSALLK
jgi:hypothetical protein